MPFFVYIIYSAKLDRFYVGHTENVETRLGQHNTRFSTFTSKASDWILVYTEEYPERKSAHLRELEIKKKKSRKYIEYLISLKGKS